MVIFENVGDYGRIYSKVSFCILFLWEVLWGFSTMCTGHRRRNNYRSNFKQIALFSVCCFVHCYEMLSSSMMSCTYQLSLVIQVYTNKLMLVINSSHVQRFLCVLVYHSVKCALQVEHKLCSYCTYTIPTKFSYLQMKHKETGNSIVRKRLPSHEEM